MPVVDCPIYAVVESWMQMNMASLMVLERLLTIYFSW